MPMDVAEVAARARTENFPVASLLFPRRLRPHLRAVYGFARLVDILGDEWQGDRLSALDELERELDRCYRPDAEPSWPTRPSPWVGSSSQSWAGETRASSSPGRTTSAPASSS